MKNVLSLLILIFVCLQSTRSAPQADGRPDPLEFSSPWKQWHEEQKIKIYHHPWPGDGIGTYKVVTVVDGSPRQLVNLMMRVDLYYRWVPNYLHANLLEKRSDTEVVYTLGMESPWPVANRDWVNLMKVTEDPKNGHTLIQFEALTDIYPEQESFLRVKRNFGSWTLIPVSPEKTQLIWMWYTDPAGAIPNWIISWGVKKQVIESISNIKKEIKIRQGKGE